jgi:hypothetical protein
MPSERLRMGEGEGGSNVRNTPARLLRRRQVAMRGPIMKRFRLAMLGLAALVMLLVPSASSAATIANGGFESGDFTGWTVVNQPGGSGDWFVYSGTSSPLNGFTIAAPPEGTHAAVTDQGGPASHVLYQDVALEAGFKHTLSFDVYYNNHASAFATPPSLDFNVFLTSSTGSTSSSRVRR